MESRADGFAYCQDEYSLGIGIELIDEEKRKKKNESKREKEWREMSLHSEYSAHETLYSTYPAKKDKEKEPYMPTQNALDAMLLYIAVMRKVSTSVD